MPVRVGVGAGMGNEQGVVRKDGLRERRYQYKYTIGRCIALRNLRELNHIFRYVTICDLPFFSSLEPFKHTIRYLN